MGTEFTFHDYVDEAGVNIIDDWLAGIPVAAKVKLDKRLIHLQALPPGQWKRGVVDTLDGDCAGLFEVRAALNNVQYRILGKHTPQREPTLLFCFTKTGFKINKVPKLFCLEAFARAARSAADPLKARRQHSYGRAGTNLGKP